LLKTAVYTASLKLQINVINLIKLRYCIVLLRQGKNYEGGEFFEKYLYSVPILTISGQVREGRIDF